MPTLPSEGPVTDADIEAAFKGTNFGSADHRALLARSVMSIVVGYHCGHTITQIMITMGFITPTRRLKVRGRKFLSHHFHDWLMKGG